MKNPHISRGPTLPGVGGVALASSFQVLRLVDEIMSLTLIEAREPVVNLSTNIWLIVRSINPRGSAVGNIYNFVYKIYFYMKYIEISPVSG